MPYRIYKTLGTEEMKKVDRGITMINHTQAEAMGKLTNVFFYHQTFRAARFDVLRTAESDSDDKEEYVIKRNKFGAPIYGPKPAPYLNCTNPEDRLSAIQMVTNPFRKISVWKKAVSLLGSLPVPLKQVNWKPEYKGLYTKEEEATWQWRTKIRLTDPYGNIYLQGFTTKKTEKKLSKYHKLSDIMSPNWLGLYQAAELNEDEFNVYFEGGLRSDENFNIPNFEGGAQDDHLWWMKKKGAGTKKESQICCGQFITKLARKTRVLTNEVIRSLSAPICCRDLDTITLRELIDSEGKLNPEDPQPGVPRVGIPRPPRACMQDLYDRVSRMKIRQEAIERMEYRQSYH
ncbi:hypothetical protein Tco_0462845 [Tanacetum coccineum]